MTTAVSPNNLDISPSSASSASSSSSSSSSSTTTTVKTNTTTTTNNTYAATTKTTMTGNSTSMNSNRSNNKRGTFTEFVEASFASIERLCNPISSAEEDIQSAKKQLLNADEESSNTNTVTNTKASKSNKTNTRNNNNSSSSSSDEDTEEDDEAYATLTYLALLTSLYLPLLLFLWIRRSMFGTASLCRSLFLGHMLRLVLAFMLLPPSTTKTFVPTWLWNLGLKVGDTAERLWNDKRTQAMIPTWLHVTLEFVLGIENENGPTQLLGGSNGEKDSWPPPALVVLGVFTFGAFLVHPDGLTWVMLNRIRHWIQDTFQKTTNGIHMIKNGTVKITLAEISGVLAGIIIIVTIIHAIFFRSGPIEKVRTPHRNEKKGHKHKKGKKGKGRHHHNHSHGSSTSGNGGGSTVSGSGSKNNRIRSGHYRSTKELYEATRPRSRSPSPSGRDRSESDMENTTVSAVSDSGNASMNMNNSMNMPTCNVESMNHTSSPPALRCNIREEKKDNHCHNISNSNKLESSGKSSNNSSCSGNIHNNNTYSSNSNNHIISKCSKEKSEKKTNISDSPTDDEKSCASFPTISPSQQQQSLGSRKSAERQKRNGSCKKGKKLKQPSNINNECSNSPSYTAKKHNDNGVGVNVLSSSPRQVKSNNTRCNRKSQKNNLGESKLNNRQTTGATIAEVHEQERILQSRSEDLASNQYHNQQQHQQQHQQQQQQNRNNDLDHQYYTPSPYFSPSVEPIHENVKPTAQHRRRSFTDPHSQHHKSLLHQSHNGMTLPMSSCTNEFSHNMNDNQVDSPPLNRDLNLQQQQVGGEYLSTQRLVTPTGINLGQSHYEYVRPGGSFNEEYSPSKMDLILLLRQVGLEGTTCFARMIHSLSSVDDLVLFTDADFTRYEVGISQRVEIRKRLEAMGKLQSPVLIGGVTRPPPGLVPSQNAVTGSLNPSLFSGDMGGENGQNINPYLSSPSLAKSSVSSYSNFSTNSATDLSLNMPQCSRGGNRLYNLAPSSIESSARDVALPTIAPLSFNAPAPIGHERATKIRNDEEIEANLLVLGDQMAGSILDF
mmetsp:Transcript_20251/g.23461  ORF Transcript_20251/g.23461 Transcript_20251/m.23461 type:complete len:1058 (+) Transcript_20251:280-3453(+)